MGRLRPFWVLLLVLSASGSAEAATVEYWSVRGGTTTLFLEPALVTEQAVPERRHRRIQSRTGPHTLTFPIDADSTLYVGMTDGVITELVGTIRHVGAIHLAVPGSRRASKNFAFTMDLDSATGSFTTRYAAPLLLLRNINVQFDRTRKTLVLTCDELSLPTDQAAARNRQDGTGGSVGMASIKVALERVDEATDYTPKDDIRAGPSSAAGGTIGPDVIVSELNQMGNWGRPKKCSGSGDLCVGDSNCPSGEMCDVDASVMISAFSVATRSCNIGDEEIDWFASINRHPVIAQSMHRLANHRFEQIGLAWVKHGFAAINGTFCGPCQKPAPPNQTARLGVGCSDPYTASLNGDRTYLGPRSDINPHTGAFEVPFDAFLFDDRFPLDRRLQVHEEDLDPSLNPGALYFVEGHYVTPEDALAGNGNNNASYRRITIDPPSESNGFRFVARRSIETGLTQVGQQAIRAWKDFDDEVVERDIQIPGEGLFILAAHVSDLGTGFWRYEYALQNMNSESAGSLFRVSLPSAAVVRNEGFHDVDHHSGEPFDAADWAIVVDALDRSITWSTDQFDVNPNANALRWGTLYNFRFDVNAPPDDSATVMLGLFKGPLPSVQATIVGPSIGTIDCNNNGIIDACDINCRPANGSGQGLDLCAVPAGSQCGLSSDCNGNGVPDECERDCDLNGVADTCDIATCPPGVLWCADCNGNTVPDVCEDDCDDDGIPSDCDDSEDTDGDGFDDCVDACPRTSTADACSCPDPVRCCFPVAGCFCDSTSFSSETCLAVSGVPDCIVSDSCRNGCLLGDSDNSGTVTLRDFAAFQRCFGDPITEPCLRVFDFTEDSSIDLDDYTRFIGVFVGDGGTPNPCP